MSGRDRWQLVLEATPVGLILTVLILNWSSGRATDFSVQMLTALLLLASVMAGLGWYAQGSPGIAIGVILSRLAILGGGLGLAAWLRAGQNCAGIGCVGTQSENLASLIAIAALSSWVLIPVASCALLWKVVSRRSGTVTT